MSGKSFAAFMGVLAVIALLAFGVFAKGEGRLDVGDDVPDMELEVLWSGISDLKVGDDASVATEAEGKWTLLNVWASWCNPCRDEAPALVDFQNEHLDDDFVVLGIDTQDQSDEAAEFIKEFELIYPSLHDGSGDYADALGTSGVPENFLIDPNGKVAAVLAGAITDEWLTGTVAPLIEGEEAS